MLLQGANIAAKDHTWSGWVVKAEASYMHEGSAVRKCQVCSYEETSVIPKLVPNQSVADTDTGTKVDYQDNVVPANTQVVVEKEFDGTSFKLLNNEKENFQKALFNITLESNGVKVQPNGYVLVRIPVPAGFSTSKLYVYYVSADDNRFELIPSYVENGFICFETTHFSDYAIVDESKTVTPANDEPAPSGKVCKYCGETHTGPFGWLIKLIHSILALFGLH